MTWLWSWLAATGGFLLGWVVRARVAEVSGPSTSNEGRSNSDG